MSDEQHNETVKHPIWKSLADSMAGEATYGKTYTAEFFEKGLRCKRDTREFQFAMLSLRQHLEREHGYYLKSSLNGDLWNIPEAGQHEDVACAFDGKMKRYAVRSVNIRSATLFSEKANLLPEDRTRMEWSLERASVRLALLNRSKSIGDYVREHAPKLLGKVAA